MVLRHVGDSNPYLIRDRNLCGHYTTRAIIKQKAVHNGFEPLFVAERQSESLHQQGLMDQFTRNVVLTLETVFLHSWFNNFIINMSKNNLVG